MVTSHIPYDLSGGVYFTHGSGGISPPRSISRMAGQHEAAHTTTGTHLNVYGWRVSFHAQAKLSVE